jgi:hypothetical protein
MPLAFGWLPPRMLVPKGFTEWSTEERSAVICHETAHIARHDLLGELVAQLTTIVYWWHPVVWWLARQMRLSQELATDQKVVAKGFERAGYARALLNVVSRLSQSSHGSRPLCVAMSASGNLNNRVNAILYWNHFASWRRGSLMTIVLLSVIAASSIRVQLIAQTSTGDRPEPAASSNDSDQETVTERVSAGSKTDLVQRLEECEVLSVRGIDHAGRFNVSGVVVDNDGKPVPNATVVLRESANMRLNIELRKDKTFEDVIEQFRRQACRDVFAKTYTDIAGRFHFENVKAPSTEGKYEDGWQGSVVAGVSNIGLGWKNISKSNSSDDFNDKKLYIQLHPTTEISGTYRSPEGEELADELVYVNSVQHPSPKPIFDFRSTELEVIGSQLGLTGTTNSQGAFSFSGLPSNMITSIAVTPPTDAKFQRILAFVSTGTVQREFKMLNKNYQVVSSPVAIVADPGEAIRGHVTDESGAGVPNVTIRFRSFAQTFSTDASGRFEIRLPTGSFGDFPSRKTTAPIYFSPDKEKTDLLHQRIELDATQLANPSSIDLKIKLIRGTLVNGRVVDNQGMPLADCIVREFKGLSQFPFGTKTDSDGKFSLGLPLGKHALVFGSDQSGIDLPAISSLHRIDPARDNIKDWIHREVEVSSYDPIELEPLVIGRLSSVKLVVTINGTPVSGAKLVVRQRNTQTGQEQVVLSAEDGTAEFVPSSKPDSDAVIEASWSDGQRGYFGSAKLQTVSDKPNNLLQIELKEGLLIEGRVTLDGQPWENVSLSVSERTPVAGSFGAHTSSNPRFVQTDDQGIYRVSVSADKNYSILIRSLPGGSGSLHVGKTVNSQSGKVRVADFAISTHRQEIAGVVVDQSGNPLVGAQVRISGNESEFWHRHREKSQFETDDKGRFHLRHLPEGNHDLLVLSPSQSGTREARIQTIKGFQAGNLNVRIELNTGKTSEPRRLQAKQIRDQ